MKHRILVTSRILRRAGPEPEKILTEAGCEVVWADDRGSLAEEALIEVLPGISAVIAGMDHYSSGVFEQAPDLKVVSRWGVGYDSVDVAAATRHGVLVTLTPGPLAHSVADLAFALMMAVARSIVSSDRSVRAGTWEYPGGVYIWGKRLGIVGLGQIGKLVARRARGFDMDVVAYDPMPDEEFAQEHNVSFVTLDELISTSDFVSLHANLTEETRGMIGEAELRRMRATAYLINTGRGALVDETALVRALKEGWIAGAGLDVYAQEPLPKDHELSQLDNCVLTPHCGSSAIESIRATSKLAVDNVLMVLRGERCPHALNPEVYESPGLRAPPRGEGAK